MPVSAKKRTITWTTRDGNVRKTQKYVATFRDNSGRRQRANFDTKREAQRWLDERTADHLTGRYFDPKAGRRLFTDYAEDWLAVRMSKPSTVATYRSILDNHLLPAFGGLRLDQISEQLIRRRLRDWADTSEASTVHARYNLLATILRSAVGKAIPVSPCDDIKKEQLPQLRTSSLLVPIVAETVLELADAIAPRLRAFVVVGAGTGMRRGELLGLTLDRIGFEFGTIRVDRQLSRTGGKNGHTFDTVKRPSSVRTIDSVAPVVLESIQAHIGQFGTHQSGLLFTSRTGHPVSSGTLHAAWQRAAREVGTTATPHDLRHYFASAHIAGGTSITKLARLLGHKNTSETLDTYGHLMGDESEHARSVIQNALGKKSHSRATVERNLMISEGTVTGQTP